MVVDACFIASQIDVWTQAYNGPTSRRKYVLNLLNVLHKNVTEEYKTDQFLHVIYWFLIYKSNLGHFFRNEGIFPPPPPLLLPPTSSCTDLTSQSGACRHCHLQDVHMCPHMCPHVVHAPVRLSVYALRGMLGSCRLWVEGTVWSLLHLCDFPHLKLKIWGGGLIRGPQRGVASLRSGPCGLLPKWPIFSRT